ncbi:MAG: hypothetical protein MI810_09140, partial [Flavobacteriales bacterium]|nr:hypothetical protein [Flavobacteriales bacterium]
FDLFRNRVTWTKEESVSLADIDPADTDLKPPHITWKRKVRAREGDLAFSSDFAIGTYKIRGETPWILKTLVLQAWEDTQMSLPAYGPVAFESTLSQTYWPFHHNFVETIVIEPGLEPGVDPALMEYLESNNIRGWIISQDSANVNPSLTSEIKVWTLDDRLAAP